MAPGAHRRPPFVRKDCWKPLTLDLATNDMADCNWITADPYNDQRATLANGYGQFPDSGRSTDAARLVQRYNLLARGVPLILASDAYKDHGMIVLGCDESESGGDPSRTLSFNSFPRMSPRT